MGRGKSGTFIRVHAKSSRKAKLKHKKLTSRSQGRDIRVVMRNIKVYIQGRLAYYGIADMKDTIEDWNGWLRRRLREYIRKQLKKPETRTENSKKLGAPEWMAYEHGYLRKDYWRMLQTAITDKRLVQAGYSDILRAYKSLHICD